MKKIIFVSLFALICNALAVDFDVSMQTVRYPKLLENSLNQSMQDYFHRLYDINNPAHKTHAAYTKIPMVIHQIWLGKKLPEEYVPYRASWIKHHPTWLFIFWADNPVNFDQGTTLVDSFEGLQAWLNRRNEDDRFCVVDVRGLAFDNRSFYDLATNYGEKSDILKWEIVFRLGGVYIDTDFECLRPLDFFNQVYDFYSGIQPLDTHYLQLGAALYGAVPGHPILDQCVSTIKDNQDIPQIVLKTGPLHFTRCFFSAVNKNGNCDIALPAGYFYPCGYDQRGMDRSVWERQESYAVHHWAGSWLKPDGFERKT